MASVGTQLKQARERLQITVEEAAERLRSSAKVIKSIESDNFGFLEPVYAKMFVKSYASLLKVYNNRFRDELDDVFKNQVAPPKSVYVVDEYEKEIKETKEIKQRKPKNTIDMPKETKQPSPKPIVPAEIKSEPKQTYNPDEKLSESYREDKKFNEEIFKQHKRFQFSDLNITNIIIYSLIIIGSVVILYFTLFNNSTNQSQTTNTTQQVTNEPATADKPITNYYEKKDSLQLDLVGRDTSWIRIAPDGKKPEQFTLYSNQKKSYKANSFFEITVGKVGAVDIYRNGKILPPLGKVGSPVSNVKITKDSEQRSQYSSDKPKKSNDSQPDRNNNSGSSRKKLKKQPESEIYNLTPSKPMNR